MENLRQKGIAKSLSKERQYGFVRVNSTNIEYFFHRQDYVGDWNILVEDFISLSTTYKYAPISLVFDIVDSPKGPRAANVERFDDWSRSDK